MSAPAGQQALSEREKRKQQERHEQILNELMQDDANKVCADCGQKGTRWASWDIGVFLCIRCGGLHRKLGTHISRVKSITLDTWTPEQIASIQAKGNARVNAIYNPNPERHPVPSNDVDLEQYIRDKYERKLFMAGAAGNQRTATSNATQNSSARPASSRVPYDPPATRPVVSGTEFASELQSLRDMGFTNQQVNLVALRSTNGDVQRALDIIISQSAQESDPSKPRTHGEEVALSQLRSMGFTNDALSLKCYRNHNGNMDDVITSIVMESKNSNAPAPAPAATRSMPPPVAPQSNASNPFAVAPTSRPAPTPAATSNPGANLLDLMGGDLLSAPAQPAAPSQDLFGGANASAGAANPFGGEDIFGATKPAINNKQAILSLYGQQQQPQQQAPFVGPVNGGFGNSMTQPTNNSNMFGNPMTQPFNNVMSANAQRPAAQHQFAQQSSFAQPQQPNPFQQMPSQFVQQQQQLPFGGASQPNFAAQQQQLPFGGASQPAFGGVQQSAFGMQQAGGFNQQQRPPFTQQPSFGGAAGQQAGFGGANSSPFAALANSNGMNAPSFGQPLQPQISSSSLGGANNAFGASPSNNPFAGANNPSNNAASDPFKALNPIGKGPNTAPQPKPSNNPASNPFAF